jgi:hypothetical protein
MSREAPLKEYKLASGADFSPSLLGRRPDSMCNRALASISHAGASARFDPNASTQR